MRVRRFYRDGWCKFPADRQVLEWLRDAGPAALATRRDPALRRQWLRAGGTWFVGVNALQNDAAGRVNGAAPLDGAVIGFVREDLRFGAGALDRAQVSICYEGYPRQDAGESDAAFRFRRVRDGAHVDGLHPVGAARQRKLLEFQGFLLGLPITRTDAGAAPLVVWQGSHHIIGAALRKALLPLAPETWPGIDLSDVYHAARRQVFETCKRVVVHALPGEAYVLHRMALHGIAPWQSAALAPAQGRAILYFRPEIKRCSWLAEDTIP